jgi:hypothetical protein
MHPAEGLAHIHFKATLFFITTKYTPWVKIPAIRREHRQQTTIPHLDMINHTCMSVLKQSTRGKTQIKDNTAIPNMSCTRILLIWFKIGNEKNMGMFFILNS